jgi:hypothetical protein
VTALLVSDILRLWNDEEPTGRPTDCVPDWDTDSAPQRRDFKGLHPTKAPDKT